MKRKFAVQGLLAAGLVSAAAIPAPLALAQVPALAASPPNVRVVRTDVPLVVQSIAPGYAGRYAELYVREIKAVGPGAGDKGTVLFVHGADTPASVAFDVMYKDYSWMAYLARAGFDVYSVDMEGYGGSTRPPAMDNPCNLSDTAQKQIIPRTLKVGCKAAFTQPITTINSDWNDVGAVVNYLIQHNNVKSVALIGWSKGGPRTAGFAARNPDKVSRLVLLAPGYKSDAPDGPPDPLTSDHPVAFESQADFKANWERQAPCQGQYEPQAAQAVWSDLAKSDPGGAKWGPGGIRSPAGPSWGFNKTMVSTMTTPVLLVSGENDKQADPAAVKQLYGDLGSSDKVFVDLACSSHNAMWEKNHLLLFQASVDWLTTGKVAGQNQGMVKLGY